MIFGGGLVGEHAGICRGVSVWIPVGIRAGWSELDFDVEKIRQGVRPAEYLSPIILFFFV